MTIVNLKGQKCQLLKSFYVHVIVHRNKFLFNKTNQMHQFPKFNPTGTGAFEQDLVLLESCLQTCVTYTSAEGTVKKLLIMGRGTARNMQSFMPEQMWEIGGSGWFFYKEI